MKDIILNQSTIGVDTMSKWKNYGLWTSLFSLLGLLLKDYIPANYSEIVTGILSVLIALGIISNPADGKGYIDKGA